MKFTNTPIKKKQLIFTQDDLTYHVKVVYCRARFGFGYLALPFFKAKLYRVNDERVEDIEYCYEQKDSQFLLSKKNSLQCTTRRKKIVAQTNLYQLVKEKIVSLYANGLV